MSEPCMCLQSPLPYVGMRCDGDENCLWIKFRARLLVDPQLAASYPIEAKHAKAAAQEYRQQGQA